MSSIPAAPRAGDDMTVRYKWTLAYIAVVVTTVLIVEILDILGVFRR